MVLMYYGSRKKVYAVAAAAVIIVVAVIVLAVGYYGSPGTTTTIAETVGSTTVPVTTVNASAQPACIASTGFICNYTTFKNNQLNVYFGQNTGENWTTASLQFVPIGKNYDYGFMITVFPAGFASGTSEYIGLAIPQGVVYNSSVNGKLEGMLYANYTTAGNSAHVVKVVAAVQVAPS